ncbi:restriction endonuclease [Rhodanobacter sp. Root179]|uniref:restriction endonuclease n=1 Tax=unclassified Rhodanobacter TaxID=2621553 RepID=UPI0009EC714C|nr:MULTISPECIES: restriction endonuclease [unclassified Rhodanobacter]
MKAWEKYQEDAAGYFRSLGLTATTNATVVGTRTSHDVDVLVQSHHVGFDITWIVECKRWQTRITKLHVLALRQIVTDLGADRGILLSEVGFQSGAQEAANLTNIQLTSIAEMRNAAGDSIYAMRFRDLLDCANSCRDRYWEISKEDRIKFGIRTWDAKYSGIRTVGMCLDLLTRAMIGSYPFVTDDLEVFNLFGIDKHFESSKEVVCLVEEKLSELEAKLDNHDLQAASFSANNSPK